jgi:hypothetical protein
MDGGGEENGYVQLMNAPSPVKWVRCSLLDWSSSVLVTMIFEMPLNLFRYYLPVVAVLWPLWSTAQLPEEPPVVRSQRDVFDATGWEPLLVDFADQQPLHRSAIDASVLLEAPPTAARGQDIPMTIVLHNVGESGVFQRQVSSSYILTRRNIALRQCTALRR